MNNAGWIIALLAPVLFVVVWTLVVGMIRRWSRMIDRLVFDPGPPLRQSGLGSGVVNGVELKNCLKVTEYDEGWLLSTMIIFGGGKLWLERAETEIGALEPPTWLRPKSRVVQFERHQVRLYGPLADLVTPVSLPSEDSP